MPILGYNWVIAIDPLHACAIDYEKFGPVILMRVHDSATNVGSECFISAAHVTEAEKKAGNRMTYPANMIKIKMVDFPLGTS